MAATPHLLFVCENLIQIRNRQKLKSALERSKGSVDLQVTDSAQNFIRASAQRPQKKHLFLLRKKRDSNEQWQALAPSRLDPKKR